jgi:hypothetical protein
MRLFYMCAKKWVDMGMRLVKIVAIWDGQKRNRSTWVQDYLKIGTTRDGQQKKQVIRS